MFCFIIRNQGLGKLHSLILGHIIDVKLLTAPYSGFMKGSSVMSMLEDEEAPSLYSCRFGGSLVSLSDSPELYICCKDINTYMKSAKSHFHSP